MSVLTEPLPIELFITVRFSDSRIRAAMENWRVEPEKVQAMIVVHFREMGIFSVTPLLESEVFDRLISFLKNSTEILTMVRKADEAEHNRKQSRHADS